MVGLHQTNLIQYTDCLGMGNRFRNMINYKTYVTAHAVLAGMTFLFVIPAAIFMARFYHRNPRTALRFHIGLQILAVLLSTAAFILGFQAVGLQRSLTNPHHGIGVALYTLVLVQAIGGSVIHRWEKNKERFKIPLKLMVRGHTSYICSKLTDIDSSMAGPTNRHPGHCTSPTWLDPVWLPEGLVHPLCYLGLCAPDTVLHSLLHQPAGYGI
jgi:hypothetical protein